MSISTTVVVWLLVIIMMVTGYLLHGKYGAVFTLTREIWVEYTEKK